MSSGLRAILRLPEVEIVRTTEQAEAFGRLFRQRIDGVNRRLRVVAAQAGPAEHQPLEGQRMRLIEAFQKTTAQIDPADPAKSDKAIQRLLAAIDVVEGNVSKTADGATAGSDEWKEREEEFDDAMLQIRELEEAEHPKAEPLRKLGDAIRSRANDRKFQQAVVALDQLLPKLEKIYTEHQQEVDGDGETAEVEGVEGQVVDDGPREGLTILVKDAETGEAVEGAAVQVGDQSDTTSSNGLATVELPIGVLDYEVSVEGYQSASDTVEVIEGDNPELVVELTAGTDEDGPREGLTVLVRDAETAEPIADVRVTVGDQTDVTSSHGLATVELTVGTHDYEALADGHEGASGQVEIVEGDNPELVIDMEGFSGPREGFTVFVRDSESGEKLEGVEVTVGDQFDVTGVEGLATVELPVGNHTYEVVAEGYETDSGDVEIIAGDNPELEIDLVDAEESEDEKEGDDVLVGDDEAGEDDDLSDELEDCERFIVSWDEALSNVSDQVDKLRKAMEGSDDFGIKAVRDGLANVMDKFPDLDLEPLAAAARAEDVDAYEKKLGQTTKEIRQVRELLANGPLLSTIDENPFTTTTVHATINSALNEIVDELDIKIKNPKPKLKLALAKRKGLKVAKRKGAKRKKATVKKVRP